MGLGAREHPCTRQKHAVEGLTKSAAWKSRGPECLPVERLGNTGGDPPRHRPFAPASASYMTGASSRWMEDVGRLVPDPKRISYNDQPLRKERSSQAASRALAEHRGWPSQGSAQVVVHYSTGRRRLAVVARSQGRRPRRRSWSGSSRRTVRTSSPSRPRPGRRPARNPRANAGTSKTRRSRRRPSRISTSCSRSMVRRRSSSSNSCLAILSSAAASSWFRRSPPMLLSARCPPMRRRKARSTLLVKHFASVLGERSIRVNAVSARRGRDRHVELYKTDAGRRRRRMQR